MKVTGAVCMKVTSAVCMLLPGAWAFSGYCATATDDFAYVKGGNADLEALLADNLPAVMRAGQCNSCAQGMLAVWAAPKDLCELREEFEGWQKESAEFDAFCDIFDQQHRGDKVGGEEVEDEEKITDHFKICIKDEEYAYLVAEGHCATTGKEALPFCSGNMRRDPCERMCSDKEACVLGREWRECRLTGCCDPAPACPDKCCNNNAWADKLKRPEMKCMCDDCAGCVEGDDKEQWITGLVDFCSDFPASRYFDPIISKTQASRVLGECYMLNERGAEC